jgi:hypothetical protein
MIRRNPLLVHGSAGAFPRAATRLVRGLRAWPTGLGLAGLLVLGIGCMSSASASTRNYLTVEGRVIDRAGNSMGSTWIFCTGSRRASAMTDSAGRYQLQIPGATLEQLQQASLRIRIQARHKGYTFALATGQPELGLEMKVIKQESRLASLLVRSNDSSAVQAVASSAVLDANPRALITAVFVGSKGTQPETSPVPLTVSDEVTLAGDTESIPEADGDYAAPGTPVPLDPRLLAKSEAGAKPRPDDPGAVLRVEPPGTKSASRAAAPQGVSAPGSAASSSGPSTMSAPSSNTSGAGTTNATGGAAPAQTVTNPKTKKTKPPKQPKNSDKPRVYRPGLDARANPDPPSAGTASPDPPAAPSATSQSAPDPPAPSAQNPPASTSGSVYDASGGGFRPKSNRKTTGDLFKEVLERDEALSDVGRVPPPPATQVGATDRKIGDPAAPPGSANTLPTCDCAIRGTVEVQSDRPLPSSTEVVIAVEGAEYSTTVELFMGSPRAFEIKSAPCGVHRILMWTRSKQRFVLTTAEPRAECTPGNVQQMRLIMEPVARWGSR